MIPSKKELEMILSALRGFEKPRAELEQYMTPSSLAAEILWQAYLDKNIEEKIVVDLGCGTGIIALGAALLGAKKVYGYDIDEDALSIAKENKKEMLEAGMPVSNVIFIAEKIESVEHKCDTILMNPPFGIQRGAHGADRKFLEKAFKISKVVYSFHRIEKTNFPEKVAEENGFTAVLMGEREFPIKASMEFHEKKKYMINVGLWRFVPK